MKGALASLGVALAAVLGFFWWNPLPLSDWIADPGAGFTFAEGFNPNPAPLLRPAVMPLSAMAQLGREIFNDKSLSSSGKLACASCHDPRRAYGPPDAGPAMFGGPSLKTQGVRAVPSLMYLDREPNFSIGPDNAENETVNLAGLAAASAGKARANKSAGASVSAAALVPQGGLFWDGRADTLQNQALIPLLSPFEMDGGSVTAIAAKLELAIYAPNFVRLFGTSIFGNPQMAVAEAMFAVARFQIEESSFHPYSSKYDAWLEGKARFSRAELKGYLAFNDPMRGNCAACHLDQRGGDGLPPLFTDHQFEALGVPRNKTLTINRDPSYFDLGLCGPWRTDMKDARHYCGLFITPTLRNVATRRAFFHNGIYTDLAQVLDFYNFRDTQPKTIYPSPDKFDDLPPAARANVDVTDQPFPGRPDGKPAMTPSEERDIIAFLGTLTDGYNQGEEP